MTDEYHITPGDTEDPFLAQCIGSDGDPVDLEDARITLTIKDLTGRTQFETQAESADNDEPGWVRYAWRRRETSSFTPGYYRVTVTVRWSDGRRQSFPNGGSAAIMSVSEP